MTPNDVKIIADNIDDFVEIPGGVENLRKAVFTLAVSGKLVPQDKKEGTADTLYLRIQKERTKVEKNSVNCKKKSKEALLIDQSEISFEIPKTWKWVRLSEIASIFNGTSINKHEKEIKYKGVIGTPYIGTKDVGFDHVINYESGVSIPESEWKNFKIASKDSVFVCAEGGSAGRKVAHIDQDVFFGNKLFAIYPPSILDSKYIFYYCISGEFFNAFQSVLSGLIGGVSINKFGGLLLPLPPLGEQKRIIKKVEEVMKQLDEFETKKKERDEVRGRLAQSAMKSLSGGESKIAFGQLSELIKTPSDIKELENAILTLAVSGRLVPQDIKEGTAENIYIQIQEERKKNFDGNKKKTIAPIPIKENEIPFDLPKSWKWVRISDIGKVTGGGTPSTSKTNYFTNPSEEGSFPWLSPADMREQVSLYVSHGRQNLTAEGLKNSSATLMPKGSVIFSSRAPIGYVGIAINPLSTNQGFKSIVPVEGISSEFVYWYLRLRGDDINARAPGTTFKEISGTNFAKEVFPLTSYSEQKRIVKKIEEIMVLIDQLRDVVVENKSQGRGRPRK